MGAYLNCIVHGRRVFVMGAGGNFVYFILWLGHVRADWVSGSKGQCSVLGGRCGFNLSGSAECSEHI